MGEAIDMVRTTNLRQRYGRFWAIEEMDGTGFDEPGIVAQDQG